MAPVTSRARTVRVVRLTLTVLAIGLAPHAGLAQKAPPKVVNRDSASLAAGTHYELGAFKRFFLGDTYRDYWVKPIRVPELDLRRYAGGLRPLKEGGGMQTKNLRLGTPDGSEVVFRPVNKAKIDVR